MDTHYGHISDVTEVVAHSKDKVISCGSDRQAIFYKIYEDSQLVFKDKHNDTSCISCSGENFFTGSDNSTVAIWNLKTKQNTYENAHLNHITGLPSWVTAVQACRGTDLVVSGGINSKLNLYKINSTKKRPTLELLKALQPSAEQEFFKGTINTIRFSANRKVMAFSVSPDQKFGRWYVDKAKPGLWINK